MIRRCLLLLLLVSTATNAANLDYSVKGLKGEAQKNVLAHLGEAPESDQDRLNFVASARERVLSGLQALGYYQPDIDIDVQRTDPVWQLAIVVDPGEPVRIRDISIQVLGPAANDEAFTRLVSDGVFSAGDVLHHGRFDDFGKSVVALGQQRGYLDGKIVLRRVEVRADSLVADMFFYFESGPRYRFGDLIQDTVLVDDKLLESLRTFQPGDYFDQTRLREFQSRLQNTNYFSSVIVQPLRTRVQGGAVPIEVKLHPAKQHSFDAGVGYSTDTEERLSLTWRTPRINRQGHSQVTRVVYSPVNPGGRFTYSIPFNDPLDDIVQLWARLEENEYGDIDSRQGELGVRRDTRLGKWLYGYSLRGLDESWDVANTSTEHEYLLLGGSLSSRRHSGALVDPKGGFNQLYTLETGSRQIGSDIDLVRFTADLTYIFTPWQRHRIVSRAGVGAVEIAGGERTDLAPSLGFFAGGNQSIRGYAYQSLGDEVSVVQSDGRTRKLVVGGDRLVTGSLEYQYYVTDKWRGALFVDGGDAFHAGDFDAKVGTGFGIHYMTPVGAVRVEIANSVSEENPDWYLHLTVGAEF